MDFEKYKLDNGLTVIVNTDTSTPLVAMNILYKVGARNENKDKTGFAHLFEHLMFGGSVNIPSYDEPLQRAGGENNAFTNNDFTNYYLTIPAQNIETAFWLESDRMLSLAFSEKSLEVQRQVVVEEFKQRYLNQPYGDAFLKLRPLAYTAHPYQWPTIGKEISHIENATLMDVKSFFSKYYHPANAILSLSGNIDAETALKLSQKWFGVIEPKQVVSDIFAIEPEQTEKRSQNIHADVPLNALYKAWHCGGRMESQYYATDLLTDVLSNGKSSRLYNSLVKDKKIFSTLHLYMLGDINPSLVVADGKLYDDISHETAEQMLSIEISNLINDGISDDELVKVKNKAVSSLVFGEINIATRALHLAYFEMLGNASLIDKQEQEYKSVSKDLIQIAAKNIFKEGNSSVLYYHSNKSKNVN